MISKINVQKFGLFNNYLWNNSMGRDVTFKKLNVIYGRNYSGKTTLSRIFRCVEISQLHNDYIDCNFTLTLDDTTEVTHRNIGIFVNQVRVYNSDFVRHNLNWLHNSDGTIKPFTILGAVNVEIENRIQQITDQLGNIEEETGLRHKYAIEHETARKQSESLENKKASLNKRLTDKAREIKNQGTTYNLPNYNINTIKSDIKNIDDISIMTDEGLVSSSLLLKEESRPIINKNSESKPAFTNFYARVKELVEKTITPSKPISDLINDAILQEWVRSGVELHKDKKAACGFCGGVLPNSLWEKLNKHFNKESEQLRQEIKFQKEVIFKAVGSLTTFLNLTKATFYKEFHVDITVRMVPAISV